MQRREFMKLSLVTGAAILVPSFTYSKDLDLSQITFSPGINSSNDAQTILVYLYGGASQLAGNLTNIDEIKVASQSDYDAYFRNITKTENDFWKEAGGDYMEKLIADGDMTVFRSCYSKVREKENNKAHGLATRQNQKGSFDNKSAGILVNLAHVLESEKIVNENTRMPFITLEGESAFYSEGSKSLSGFLKPVAIDESLKNPYSRNIRHWSKYSREERKVPKYSALGSEGFDPKLDAKLNKMSEKHNDLGKIQDAFKKRFPLDSFMQEVTNEETPYLGENAYPENRFSKKLETAIKLLSKNPDTKVITIGANGLGGWDDHDNSIAYVKRSKDIFATLVSAMAHIRAKGKEQNVNIMVFGEFGRNVNLNTSLGWDHGNLQNFYVLGGKGYFDHKGVVGETVLEDTGRINRLYLKPKPGTYEFEPLSIAATLYKIYGIDNPEMLTGGHKEIEKLFP